MNYRTYASRFVLAFLLFTAAACGGGSGGGGGGGDDDGGDDDTPGDVDAAPVVVPPGGECTPGEAECNNCIDDDEDGRIDGDDIECTAGIDDDESDFSTGISGDNMDPMWQDCFFDGDSGGGQDCRYHTCCITGEQPCTDDCQITQVCVDECAPLVPPGCDCFGCCTICDGDGCVDVYVGADTCDNGTEIRDPAQCPACFKYEACGADCTDDNPDDCSACPGQELPASCTECANGGAVCSAEQPCADGQYCSNGCCVFVID